MRLRLREGLSAGKSVVVCKGVLVSAIRIGKLNSVLLCKPRLRVIPRGAGGDALGEGVSACNRASCEACAISPTLPCAMLLGRKICTTACVICVAMRCTGQYKLINHSAKK